MLGLEWACKYWLLTVLESTFERLRLRWHVLLIFWVLLHVYPAKHNFSSVTLKETKWRKERISNGPHKEAANIRVWNVRERDQIRWCSPLQLRKIEPDKHVFRTTDYKQIRQVTFVLQSGSKFTNRGSLVRASVVHSNVMIHIHVPWLSSRDKRVINIIYWCCYLFNLHGIHSWRI